MANFSRQRMIPLLRRGQGERCRRGHVKGVRNKAEFTSIREFGFGRRFSAWLLHINCV